MMPTFQLRRTSLFWFQGAWELGRVFGGEFWWCGHDVIDNYEFPCNSVNSNENFKSVEVGPHSSDLWGDFKDILEELSEPSLPLLAFYTWLNRVTEYLCTEWCRSHGIGGWLKFHSRGVLQSCLPSSTITQEF